MSTRADAWPRAIVRSSSRCCNTSIVHRFRSRAFSTATTDEFFIVATITPRSAGTISRDHQLCSGVEFLALLVPHFALKHECRIHCFGAISTTIRRQLGWIRKGNEAQAPGDEVEVEEEDESEFVRLRRANWARLIARTWLEDPSLCNCCGQAMKVLSAISSPAQDEAVSYTHLTLPTICSV